MKFQPGYFAATPAALKAIEYGQIESQKRPAFQTGSRAALLPGAESGAAKPE